MAQSVTRSRVIKVVFAVSLALNLLVVGMVAGAIWRHGGLPDRAQFRDGHGASVAGFVHALPRADRRALRRQLRDPELRQTMKTRQSELLKLLRAEVFRGSEMTELLTAQHADVSTFQIQLQAALVEKISAMSADDRRAFATRIEARPRKRRHRE